MRRKMCLHLVPGCAYAWVCMHVPPSGPRMCYWHRLAYMHMHAHPCMHTHAHAHAPRMCYWRRLLDGWSKRLAYTPSLESRPRARTEDGHYTCGECRRPPNPQLIGPFPPDHPCAAAAGAAGGKEAMSVARCRDDAGVARSKLKDRSSVRRQPALITSQRWPAVGR